MTKDEYERMLERSRKLQTAITGLEDQRFSELEVFKDAFEVLLKEGYEGLKRRIGNERADCAARVAANSCLGFMLHREFRDWHDLFEHGIVRLLRKADD